MTYDEVLQYCGGTGYKMAKLFGVSQASPCNWKRWGFIPIKSQMRIEELSNGELKADINHHVMDGWKK